MNASDLSLYKDRLAGLTWEEFCDLTSLAPGDAIRQWQRVERAINPINIAENAYAHEAMLKALHEIEEDLR